MDGEELKLHDPDIDERIAKGDEKTESTMRYRLTMRRWFGPRPHTVTEKDMAEKFSAHAADVGRLLVAGEISSSFNAKSIRSHRAFARTASSFTNVNRPYKWTICPSRGRGISPSLQVDAQNSFGAMLRSTIDCKTRESGGEIYLTSFNSFQRIISAGAQDD